MTGFATRASFVRGGLGLAYAEVRPTAAAEDSSPLVLLHSLGTDHSSWELCLPALAGRRIIAPDSAGHGGSDAGSRGSMSAAGWVDDLDRLLTDLSLPPVVLVGVSMGGMQAIAYAAAHPDRVRALVVADSFARLDRDVAQGKIEQQRQAVADGTMAEVADQYLASTFAQPYPEGAELVRSALASLRPDDYLAAVETTFGIDIAHLLPRVAAPALVLWGDRDAKAPRVLSERIAAGIPHARLRVVPDAGHLPNIDNPAAFAREVTGFLENEGL